MDGLRVRELWCGVGANNVRARDEEECASFWHGVLRHSRVEFLDAGGGVNPCEGGVRVRGHQTRCTWVRGKVQVRRLYTLQAMRRGP